ncbi:unnamed protein product [Phytophthora lilii]|uniref:Unnamed protein product n=1 Tax=Phytophthora lilii TaxID=2077276 RepID=A0A9W6WZV9_9STRA|nr:unnamed protein product [Phytophthora lilii]
MVGSSKHKNGIICTFPDCNKPMRTQKFKMHFTKAHLKQGEVYSVEHRRQYEVAREDNASTAQKHELVSVAAVPPSATVEGIPRVDTMGSPMLSAASVTTVHEDIQMTYARTAPTQQPSRVEASVARAVKNEESASGTASANAVSLATAQLASIAPTSGQTEHTSGSKRPASAMDASPSTVDPTSVLLMQFIALMDQRFQELVGKMGEMIDVQKDLIDTLQASNPNGQAPASAFSHAVEVVMKKRKKGSSPRTDSDSANDKATADSNGENQGGFVL